MSRHNRIRVAERVTAEPTVTMPAHLTYVAPLGAAQPVRNRRSPQLTATQRDSQGRLSAWTRSPFAPKGGWR